MVGCGICFLFEFVFVLSVGWFGFGVMFGVFCVV